MERKKLHRWGGKVYAEYLAFLENTRSMEPGRITEENGVIETISLAHLLTPEAAQ